MSTRVVKAHDVRKSEILDCAERLFYTVGYEETTVSTIIAQTHIAKGTFYYYFSSKEELLDSLVERFTARTMAEIRPILATDAPAPEKLGRFHEAAGAIKGQNAGLLLAVVRVLYSDENLVARHKLMDRTMAAVAPVYAQVVREGVAEGTFDTAHPEEAAEMMLRVWWGFGDSLALLLLDAEAHPENFELMERRLAAFEETAERILGAPQGSLHFAEAGRRALAGFRRELAARQREPDGGRT